MDREKHSSHDEEIGKRLSPAFKLLVEFCSESEASAEHSLRYTSENVGRKSRGDQKEAGAR